MGRRHIGVELKESYFNLAAENCWNAERMAATETAEQSGMFEMEGI